MKKKTIRIALALCGLFFVTCNNAKRKKLLASENVEADQAEPTYELIGQRVQLLYEGGMKAEMQYLNDTTLHWKTIVNDSVAQEQNSMVQRRIDNSRFFVNWIENDGTTASQVIDFKEKTVTVFLTFTGPDGKRNSQLLTGRLELLRE